ncbi:MAG: glycosyltransferase, partial [Halobacteriaceae archaeon]
EPLSLYEAMASGLPCIVSDIPNLQFINSEDCGITVDFSTPDQAATDLMRYIETGNPDKHASNARSYAESHLGWTSRSEEYYDPLKTIATNEE